jgi:hypothetical protein
MAVKSMEMAVEATASMEMDPGALPHPGRVPEQRVLSLEIHRWRRRSCRTSSRKTPIDLGFSIPRLYIGGEAASKVGQGHLTIGPHGPRGAPPYGEAALWPRSGSLLVLVLRPRKIGVSAFILSNSENISCVAFLRHKNNRKQGTGTVAS